METRELVCPLIGRYFGSMKTVAPCAKKSRELTVPDEKDRASGLTNLEEDTPELAGELLQAAKRTFTPYSRGDLESVAAQVLRETALEL